MFTRSSANPILRPNSAYAWKSRQVYNPAAVFIAGRFYLFYRARGQGENRHSVIGRAVSADGLHFQCDRQPAIVPYWPIESQGVEDPRLTKIGRRYFMTYTAYDGQVARLCFLTSQDLTHWQRQGEMIAGWNRLKAQGFAVPWDLAQKKSAARLKWLKSGAIFPEKIKGEFWLLFGDSNIWLARSADGQNWRPVYQPFLRPRKKYFDSVQLEVGPPPIKTRAGWLVFYHGIGHDAVYRLGYFILAINNPQKIIFRSSIPVLEPQADYELKGKVDIGTQNKKVKVIFATAAVVYQQTVYLYYGAADTYVCLAQAPINKISSNDI